VLFMDELILVVNLLCTEGFPAFECTLPGVQVEKHKGVFCKGFVIMMRDSSLNSHFKEPAKQIVRSMH